MKFTRMVSLLLMITIIVGIGSVSANAAIIKPDYVQTSDVSNCLDVSGRTLLIDASTSGYFNATQCGVTATLQKLSGSSWLNFRVWNATSPSSHPDYVLFSTTLAVAPGTYRLVTSHAVTVGSYSEYEQMISDIRTVS